MKIETEYAFEVIRRSIINDMDEPLDELERRVYELLDTISEIQVTKLMFDNGDYEETWRKDQITHGIDPDWQLGQTNGRQLIQAVFL